ncbi:acyl-CoA dehydrogenase [Brevibacterium siliguriense]|uniref:Acyl-CoA dehydrogenase n=1 Tax=Brevibacterium siliguriense TaxID=1136497 RepID=A0A1H1Y5G4_9MICO|nr:acyl-CoA dehydrogenase family protein [Brevibacterium siliguriense]SDT16625.1 acyl-CoA dehydrogenase [Brevibacterium siliguriense]
MDFSIDDRTLELKKELESFMEEFVFPAEDEFAAELEALDNPYQWTASKVMQRLRAEAKKRGLWNLFLPGEEGAGLTNVQYATLAEVSGRSRTLAPAAMNCAAPDTGNMELLAQFGTEEQKKRWLEPMLKGTMRSAFAMTEPAVASSDATNVEMRIERDGDAYVINGRKWFITGALNPDAELLIVMGKTDPNAERHKQQSQIIVPRDTPGVDVSRSMEVLGYSDKFNGGHGDIAFTDVRVPASNLIGGEGEGFAIAQARLGPGRIHHCMRAIGMAERAISAMCSRADSRTAFGKKLSDQGVILDWIAESRVRIEQLRVLVLKTAWLMDTVGNKGAHTEIQAIKIATPAAVEWILDKAIQVHGAGGLSQDFDLASSFAYARTLRFADGPDEVHKNSLARRELKRQRAESGCD